MRALLSIGIFLVATAGSLSARSQVVNAVPDSGTADAGIASRPIANVATNDTVGGAPATLGASGNAVLSKVGTWPTGLGLNVTTGAVSTTVAVTPGTYTAVYQLCARGVPTNCAQATDTVTVITPSIVAGADSGTALVGVASTPIANVASNDSVNGAPATLGSKGNATVAPSGSWPTGLSLATSTGAISTNTATPAGVFNLAYQLCDRNSPPDCAPGTAVVTVTAAIVALPVAGTTTFGVAATAIPNVAAKDTVNGAAVVLSAPANATLAQSGTWPSGIALNTATGAVTITATVPAAVYALSYQLCDLYSDCATAVATVTVIAPYAEIQATATQMGDVEFDWGRDGIPCPTCNFGDGNDRANWTDRDGNIWIAHLDPSTGLFTSPGANDELADTTAFFWNVYGNGPEWAFSTQNGKVVSQLVYSRWKPGEPQTIGYTGAAFTTQTAYNGPGQDNWTPAFFPGAIGQGSSASGTANSNLPEASQCNTDAVATAIYKNFATPTQDFTEAVSAGKGTAPLLLPLPSGVTVNGIGERFVPCTHQLTFQAQAPYQQSGQTVQQVFWYDWDTGVVEQLTTDPTSKYAGFMFKAPDFGDNYILFTLASHTTIEVFLQTGSNPDGSPIMTLVNTITSPDPNEIYLNSPEPFINCTPQCATYVFATLSASADSQNGISEPNGLAVIALNPAAPLFNILVSANSLPPMQRLDPEYFISENGPLLYYNRIVPLSATTKYFNEGEYFINMQLGAPSGSCVGSSAEDGLPPGC